jgi:hypothetical protein
MWVFGSLYTAGFTGGALLLADVSSGPLDTVVDSVVKAAGALLLFAALWVARLLAKKLNVELDAAREEMIRLAVDSAINWVEEKAADALKKGLTGMSAAAKLEAAVARTIQKVPGITRSEAVNLIHERMKPLGVGASETFRIVVEEALDDEKE